LRDTDYFQAAAPESGSVLQRCVELELRAEETYQAFAKKFSALREACRFFKILALQEREHAELLQVCCVSNGKHSRQPFLSTPLGNRLPLLEQQMIGLELASRQVQSLEDALRLVVQIESSEVNQLFLSFITATESEFVSRLSAFQNAMESHLTYICRRIPELAPPLTDDCKELLAKYSWI
jgi:hypothetical protein